ncbi:MAG: glycerophosphodiester phosphodiesterase [Firmicutes bacterium]|nr:glycerophosphodiester phosphodiesterase [Bacillota bacterium]
MKHRGGFHLIGHRGAAAHAPENTLASFHKAIDMGATMLELDIHLTNDQEIVVIHDHEISRTTSGSGLVSNMTLREIREYDAGSWMHPDFKGEKVPILREVMELIHKDNIFLNIEIKAGEKIHIGLVDKLLELVGEYDTADMIVISSFHREYLKEIKEKAPAIEVALLYAGDVPDALDEAVGEGWEGLHPHFPLIDEKLIEGARQRGLAVRAWTVNRPDDMRRLMDFGVDGICSDVPDVLNKIVAEFTI